jgi:hypothetical protein
MQQRMQRSTRTNQVGHLRPFATHGAQEAHERGGIRAVRGRKGGKQRALRSAQLHAHVGPHREGEPKGRIGRRRSRRSRGREQARGQFLQLGQRLGLVGCIAACPRRSRRFVPNCPGTPMRCMHGSALVRHSVLLLSSSAEHVAQHLTVGSLSGHEHLGRSGRAPPR